jgi:serine/threonine-protein kinase
LLAWGVVAATAGPTTTNVPRFVGLSLPQARALAARDRLAVVTKSAPSTTVAKNTVMRQDYALGTVVKNGTTVTLTISSGPPPCCTVPDLTGMTVEEAKAALTKAHLTLGKQTYQLFGTQPSGTVVSQTPTPSSHLDQGKPVDIVLSAINVGGGGGEHKKHH